MVEILIGIAILGGLGLIFGLVLAAASKVFYVETDPRLDLLNEALPGANCGGCGYAGCAGYAEAVLNGEAPIGLCASGGTEAAVAMGGVMGVKVEECLLVEDSLYSMKAGRAAGCTVWAIEDPKHKRDLEVIHQTAHRYFNNHVEMRQAFEELKAQN